MELVAHHALQLPVALSIGTTQAFQKGYDYKYTWNDAIQGYVCDHQTTTNVRGKVMALFMQLTDGMTRYAAFEGTLSNQGQTFVPRQCVFRTREHFWERGDHEWQKISPSSRTNTNNTWSGTMNAATEVPAQVPLVALGVLLSEAAAS